VHVPAVRNKYLDTFTHTFLSSLHAARRLRPDVALFFIAGNSPMCLVTRSAGIPTVINVDGLDSDRSKWPALAKANLRFADRNAPRWSDTAITDSHAVAEIFEQRYGQRIGVDLVCNPDLAAQPETALHIACLYWSDHHLNDYADADNILGVSNGINRGNPASIREPNGYEARKAALRKARAVLS
jgi:hypothetical protein